MARFCAMSASSRAISSCSSAIARRQVPRPRAASDPARSRARSSSSAGRRRRSPAWSTSTASPAKSSRRRARVVTPRGRRLNKAAPATQRGSDDRASRPHDRHRHQGARRHRKCWCPEERPVPTPGDGEILVKVAAAGVNRPDVMQRKGHYPPPPGATDIPGLEIAGEVVALGRRRQALEGRRQGHGAGARRRLRRILPRARKPRAAGAGRLSMIEAAAIPETFFTVWHNVFERGGAEGRRDAAGARRLVRHRHHRDPARQGVRRARHHHRRLGGKMRGLPQARRRPRDQLQDARISSPPPRRRPAARAPTSSSTWSAATTSSATTRPPRSKAASCRSPSRARRRRRSISRRIMLKRLHHTGSTLRPRSVADKGAIARAVEDEGAAAARRRQGQAGASTRPSRCARPRPPTR